jgi:cell division protein FtsI/penicillin-binding protein 2
VFTSNGPSFPRLPLVAVASATVVAVLGARLAYLASHSSDAYASAPRFPLHAARGSMWDRDGWLLAADRYEYRVVAAPNAVKHPDTFAATVAPLLGLPVGEVAAKMSDPSASYVPLAEHVPYLAAKELRQLDLIGIDIEQVNRREYPLGQAAAHVTGFVLDDGRVAYGMESSADQVLRGRDGEQQGNYGSNPRMFTAPRNGRDVVLTIDRELQVACADIVTQAVAKENATGGTVLVMEPSTGAVLCSASVPTYDPNHYADATDEQYRDPAVAEVFEPGSVLKPITLAAAFEAGVANRDSTYVDEGTLEVAGITISNWDRTPHGVTSMTELLQYSLNVGAVHLATALGTDRFYAALARFGFGAPTGVDMNGEEAGIVHWPDEPHWYPGNLATNSFGQGLAATPIQVTAAVAALVNDGVLMTPHFLLGTVGPSGDIEYVAPRPVRRVVSTATARAVRDLMVEVVRGRVTQAAVPGYVVGGKTGTSQVPAGDAYDPEATIASFIGFMPADAPRFVAFVKLDRPTTTQGSDAAAPVFREVAEACVETLGMAPSSDPASASSAGDGP